MKKAFVILGFGVVAFGILAFSKSYFTPLYFEVPKSWPQPEYDFKKNPLTEEKFQLGRYLFYDPILSRDNTISCSSCHAQATDFTHVDHDLSHSIEGKNGKCRIRGRSGMIENESEGYASHQFTDPALEHQGGR